MAKKTKKKSKKKNEGTDLDDAFFDDGDIEYAKTKPPRKNKKDLNDELDEIEEEVEEISKEMNGDDGIHIIKSSKPVVQIKKGEKLRIDGKEYEVDQHYVLIDHKTTKEMAIELFDKNNKDYQLRYFADQVDKTLEFYELQEIMFIKKPFSKIEW